MLLCTLGNDDKLNEDSDYGGKQRYEKECATTETGEKRPFSRIYFTFTGFVIFTMSVTILVTHLDGIIDPG